MEDIEFLKIELGDEESEKLSSNVIGYKKELNKVLSEARKASKSEKCIYCGKETTSFCNSHSIPAFCLRNIATNGELLHSNKLVNFPLMDFEKGINKAGTFQVICRECDSKIFQEYEEPNNYQNEVTSQMIAQIAMKNYLKAIRVRDKMSKKDLSEQDICLRYITPALEYAGSGGKDGCCYPPIIKISKQI